MTGNYFWSAARAKNFLKKLNERGYTETKPTNYEANMAALSTQVSSPLSSVLAMNPIEFGLRAFRPQDAEPFLKELLGDAFYTEFYEMYSKERMAINSLNHMIA